MALQELVCSQCGSNELELFGANAYKCESCGTILKEEKPKDTPKPPPLPKQKPFRSKRIQHGLDDQPDFTHDPNEDHYTAGNQFMKMIFWVGVIGGLAVLCAWLLM